MSLILTSNSFAFLKLLIKNPKLFNLDLMWTYLFFMISLPFIRIHKYNCSQIAGTNRAWFSFRIVFYVISSYKEDFLED